MKINFLDFWGDFRVQDNFFLDLFRDIFGNVEVAPPDECDTIIYSCFGKQHLGVDRSKTKKIYYTGENLRPNFNECDYSLTFDFDDYQKRNVRLPLWFLQFDWYNKGGYGNPEFVIPLSHINQNEFIQTKKNKFCVFVNNNLFQDRIDCINKLTAYKNVTCFGKPFGNWFYGESKKYKIFSEYKFSICFENSVAPGGGYYTEKLIHSKLSGTIPLYFTDNNVSKDFNTKSFINLNDYDSMDDFIEYVIQVDQDDKEYLNIFNQPLFNDTLDHRHLEQLKTKIRDMIKL